VSRKEKKSGFSLFSESRVGGRACATERKKKKKRKEKNSLSLSLRLSLFLSDFSHPKQRKKSSVTPSAMDLRLCWSEGAGRRAEVVSAGVSLAPAVAETAEAEAPAPAPAADVAKAAASAARKATDCSLEGGSRLSIIFLCGKERAEWAGGGRNE